MEGVKKLQEVVKAVLTEDEQSRDDDTRLFFLVCLKKNPECEKYSFKGAMMYNSDKLPSYDTVTRCRRRIQRDCKYLRGKRYEKRMEYKQEYLEEFTDNLRMEDI